MDIRRTYVTFEFSPAFISEGHEKENFLGHGTLERVLEQYEEVSVEDRFLSTLKVPKGALRFYFYDRMTGTAYVDGEAIKTYSDPIEKSVSVWYYMENEGELITREGLARGEGFHPVHPEIRDSLLQKMDKNNCDRIFQTSVHWSEDGDLPLEPDDVVLKPKQVQMVDTEILWRIID